MVLHQIGYTEIDARYRGRLIKAGGTPLEISGAAGHSHIGSANSVSMVSSGKFGNFAYAGTKVSRLVRDHNHLGQANLAKVAEASNFPEVKKLRLVGRDASDWNYKLPPGVDRVQAGSSRGGLAQNMGWRSQVHQDRGLRRQKAD